MAKPSKPEPQIIFFDAQTLLGKPTGIANYTYKLIEALAACLPDSLFVGHYYNFLGRQTPTLPQGANITYRSSRLVPIQLVNALRRLRVEIPVEFRALRRPTLSLFPDYLSAPSIFGSPCVTIIYDLTYLDHPEYVSPRNAKDLARFVPVSLKRSAGVITISEYSKSRIEFHYPGMSLSTTVVPVPPVKREGEKHETALSKRLLDLGISSRPYILFLGTFEPRKNIRNLVEAYSSTPDLHDHFTLVLAGGSGWINEETQLYIEQCKKDGLNIIQTGYVSDDEKAALYHNAACFVLPSHYEGFGMPIFEAMQYDVPVAASNIPVFREVAQDAVLYFDKDNPADITEKLSTLLSDKGLQQRLVRSGHKRLHAYSWEENARVVAAALEKLSYKE